ncbi:hypothetical protein HY469_05845 [Candidatus Roizmanbacteria bacterium]|nr:hypothetical protein [Candidatus Roizmanbacteria bacterium]
MAKVYRLLHGKMFRKDGTKFVRDDEFVPTESEYSANKDRLKLVNEIAGTPNTPTVPDPVHENTQVKVIRHVDDVRKARLRDALDYIASVVSLQELDKLFMQEIENKPKARRGILEAIEERRLEISPKYEVSELIVKSDI